MSVFGQCIEQIDTAQFDDSFKQAVKSLDSKDLDLQNALKIGSVALHDRLSVMIIKIENHPQQIEVHTGIFFHSIIAGCNCADDPTPTDTIEEYAEARFLIDKQDGSFDIRFN